MGPAYVLEVSRQAAGWWGPYLADGGAAVAALMDQIAAKLAGVPDVAASRVATALREGYARGESPQALRRRVADVLGQDEWSAEVVRIARTTTTSVCNAAHSAAIDQLEPS